MLWIAYSHRHCMPIAICASRTVCPTCAYSTLANGTKAVDLLADDGKPRCILLAWTSKFIWQENDVVNEERHAIHGTTRTKLTSHFLTQMSSLNRPQKIGWTQDSFKARKEAATCFANVLNLPDFFQPGSQSGIAAKFGIGWQGKVMQFLAAGLCHLNWQVTHPNRPRYSS